MPTQDNERWGQYEKLVLKELERLNDNQSKMQTDLHSFDNRLAVLQIKVVVFSTIAMSVVGAIIKRFL